MRYRLTIVSFLIFASTAFAGVSELKVGSAAAAAGEDVVVPITLVRSAVHGLALRLRFDPALLTYRGVEPGTLPDGVVVRDSADAAETPGVVAWGFVSKELIGDLNGDVVLLQVKFHVRDDAQPGQASTLKVDEFDVDGNRVDVRDGTVTVESPHARPEGDLRKGDLRWTWIVGGIAGAAAAWFVLRRVTG